MVPFSARWPALAALLALAGCASSGPPAPPAQAAPPADARESRAELEALYWQRQQEARADFTPADVAFMTGMIGHHAQALVMSRLAPTHGASPAVQRLAARIINAQRDEIESMQRWLRARGQPVPTVRVDGLALVMGVEGEDAGAAVDHAAMGHTTMDHGETPPSTAASGTDHAAMGHDMGGMDHAMMPGMLTQAQLRELDAARGTTFDVLFLRYMIQHHGGATAMVDDLFAADGAASDSDAFKLASDIHVDQETEIARMDLMLRQMTD